MTANQTILFTETLEFKKFFQHDMTQVLLTRDLEQLKLYFIESDITQNNPVYSDIQYNLNHALVVACREGHIKTVEYCLTSSELTIHANIHYNDGSPIYNCGAQANAFITEYLLTSPDLNEHADIYPHLEAIFTEALSDSNDYRDTYDLFDYLIYDYKIKYVPEIVNILKEKTPPEYSALAISQLSKNTLFNELHSHLPNKSINEDKRKVKI